MRAYRLVPRTHRAFRQCQGDENYIWDRCPPHSAGRTFQNCWHCVCERGVECPVHPSQQRRSCDICCPQRASLPSQNIIGVDLDGLGLLCGINAVSRNGCGFGHYQGAHYTVNLDLSVLIGKVKTVAGDVAVLVRHVLTGRCGHLKCNSLERFTSKRVPLIDDQTSGLRVLDDHCLCSLRRWQARPMPQTGKASGKWKLLVSFALLLCCLVATLHK